MSLNDYNDEELQEELEKRKKATIPIPNCIHPDLKPLMKALRIYLEAIMTNDHTDQSNEEHNIFEVALETFYGPTIWDWINGQSKG